MNWIIIIMNAGRKPTEAGYSVARLVCEVVFGLAALSAKGQGYLFCQGFYWVRQLMATFHSLFSLLVSIVLLVLCFQITFARKWINLSFLFVYPVLPFVVLLAESGVNVFSSNFCWTGATDSGLNRLKFD